MRARLYTLHHRLDALHACPPGDPGRFCTEKAHSMSSFAGLAGGTSRAPSEAVRCRQPLGDGAGPTVASGRPRLPFGPFQPPAHAFEKALLLAYGARSLIGGTPEAVKPSGAFYEQYEEHEHDKKAG